MHTWKFYTTTLNCCQTHTKFGGAVYTRYYSGSQSPASAFWFGICIARVMVWKRNMFFAFRMMFGWLLFHVFFSNFGMARRWFSIVTVTASRSSSHCHCTRLFYMKRVVFRSWFFYAALLLFLLLLFCRRQNSYLLFQCLVECQQEGVSTTFFFASAHSKTTIQPSDLVHFFPSFSLSRSFLVAFLLLLNATQKPVPQLHRFVDIHNFYFRFGFIDNKKEIAVCYCTNCNEINTNFIFIVFFSLCTYTKCVRFVWIRCLIIIIIIICFARQTFYFNDDIQSIFLVWF